MGCKKNPKECKEAWEKMMEKKKEWCKKNPKDCAAWEKKMMEKKKKWCAENPKECAAIKKEWCEKMPTSAWCKKADDEDVTIKRKLQELTEEEPEMYEEEMPEDSEDFEDFEGSDSDSNSEEPEDEGRLRSRGAHERNEKPWSTYHGKIPMGHSKNLRR